MNQTAIIVDDERLARSELRLLLDDFADLTIIGEASNLTEAVNLILTTKPDIVFLDIQLSKENGFDLLDKVEKDFKLVFVTAFDEFAIRAFEINAIDYLLKPINPKRLAKTIERLSETEETSEVTWRKLEYEDRLFIEIGERSRFLQIKSIKCLCADGDYTRIFTDDGRQHLVAKTLKEWEFRLPEKYFVRIHRSTIVNLEFIEKVETWFSRSYQIYLRDIKEPLIVSRRYASQLKSKFS